MGEISVFEIPKKNRRRMDLTGKLILDKIGVENQAGNFTMRFEGLLEYLWELEKRLENLEKGG